jgi:hypothetical protein
MVLMRQQTKFGFRENLPPTVRNPDFKREFGIFVRRNALLQISRACEASSVSSHSFDFLSRILLTG